MKPAVLIVNVLLGSSLLSTVQLGEGRDSRNGVEYTLITANTADCQRSVAFPTPELQYRRRRTDSWTTISSMLGPAGGMLSPHTCRRLMMPRNRFIFTQKMRQSTHSLHRSKQSPLVFGEFWQNWVRMTRCFYMAAASLGLFSRSTEEGSVTAGLWPIFLSIILSEL